MISLKRATNRDSQISKHFQLSLLHSKTTSCDVGEWKSGHTEIRAHSISTTHTKATHLHTDRDSVGLMTIDAAEYSHSLMNDAAGTLTRIEAGLNSGGSGHRTIPGTHRVAHGRPGAGGISQCQPRRTSRAGHPGRSRAGRSRSERQIGVAVSHRRPPRRSAGGR